MSLPRRAARDVDSSPTLTPVSIPLGTAGVDLRVSPRNRTQSALSWLENAHFSDERTAERRNGHDRLCLADLDGYALTGAGGGTVPGGGDAAILDSNSGTAGWAYGFGALVTTTHYPRPRRAQGVARFRDEELAWTGDRLLKKPLVGRRWVGEDPYWGHNTNTTPIPEGIAAYMPDTKHQYIDQFIGVHDAALGRRYKVVVHGGSITEARGCYAYIYERSGAFVTYVFLGTGDVDDVKVIYSAGRFVVFYRTTTTLKKTSASEDNILNWTTASTVTSAISTQFDLHYISDSLFVLAWRETNNIKFAYYSGETTQTSLAAVPTTLTLTANAAGPLAISVAPNGDLAVMFVTATDTRLGIYSPNGAGTDAQFLANAATQVAVAPRWVNSGGTERTALFVGWATHSTENYTKVAAAVGQGANLALPPVVSTSETRSIYSAKVATNAFRVGDEAFVWLRSTFAGAGLQSTYELVTGAGHTKVVAACARGAADAPPASAVLWSVHPDPAENTYGFDTEATTAKWLSILPQKQPNFGVNHTTVSVIDINFLPPLRSAEYGGALYFAGGLVSCYDGRHVVEAGWINYPEIKSQSTSTTGSGFLVPGQVHRYRIYACWLSDTGEVFRSPAITAGPYTVGAGHDTRTLVITNMSLTNKQSGVYYEVYRTQNNLGTYYLAAKVKGNSFTAETFTFDDIVGDTQLLSQGGGIDPHNPAAGQAVELEETAPPACSILAEQGDRIWFAGGEIPDGQVCFSKVKELGEGLGWSDLVGTAVLDVTSKETVSIGDMNDALVVFQSDGILVQGGAGPDNLGNGSFPPASQVATTDGAVSHDGTVLTDAGIVYWSSGGPRLFTTGLQVVHIGAPVEPLTKSMTPTGVVAVPGLREVRWYTSGYAFLWDYTPTESEYGRWAVWSGLRARGAMQGGDGAVLVTPDGYLLTENSETYSDGGQPFRFAAASWEMRLGDMVEGCNVVEQVGLVGRGFGPHTLRFWVYYNGAPDFSEYWEWTPASDLDLTAVKDLSAAVNTMTTAATSPDGVYRMERKLRRTPASTVRIAFDDTEADHRTFVPHEITVIMGALAGLAYQPRRTYARSMPKDN